MSRVSRDDSVESWGEHQQSRDREAASPEFVNSPCHAEQVETTVAEASSPVWFSRARKAKPEMHEGKASSADARDDSAESGMKVPQMSLLLTAGESVINPGIATPPTFATLASQPGRNAGTCPYNVDGPCLPTSSANHPCSHCWLLK